jgi:undecaprenyl-diphosphatase
MTYGQAVVLGIVQGLTEFLPISSSGHLILVPRVLGWPDQGLAFDAAMHLGTLAALFAYFRREVRDLLTGVLAPQIGLLVVAASLPALAVGWLLNNWIEVNLRGALVVAISTAFWGLVMWVADRGSRVRSPVTGHPLERVGWSRAMAIGCAQALALIPGTSRSGITITAGLFTGLERSTAARFSFFLGIPVTAAAGAYKALGLVRHGFGAIEGGPLLVAIVAAFISGWLAVWFLVGYLQRRSLQPFVVYRLILAAIIVAVML